MRLTYSLALLSLSSPASALPTARGLTSTLSGLVSSLTGGLTNPIMSVVQTVLEGQGIVQGVLGVLEGVLGVEQTFDYVVVGGGTAGNAIGVRLAEAGHSVAIIEAGLFYELGKPVLGSTPAGAIIGIGWSPLDSIPTVDWQFMTTPQAGANNREMHYTRGKCLGGSSALNFEIYHRGSRGSYDMWADMVGDDSYTMDALMPYFEKAVNFSRPNLEKRRANATTLYDADDFAAPGAGGPVQVGYANWVSVWATWLEQGLKWAGLNVTTGFDHGDLLGYHYSQSTIRASDQTRSSSAEYIYQANSSTIGSSGLLKVYTQTMGKKVLFDDTKTATGVQVESLGVSYKINAKKEVILSAGAFQSPQLLMVSGIGPVETLKQFDIDVVSELPGVGQNMWDHVLFGPSYRVNFDTLDRVLHDPVVLAESLTEYTLDQSGPLTSNVIDFLGWEKLPQKYRDNFTDATVEALAQFPADWPEVEHISGNGFIGNFEFPALQQPLDPYQYATNLGAMVAPLSRGNVTITSADTNVLPAINPNWLTHPADQEVAVAWYRRQREIWNSDVVQQIVIGEEYWPGIDKSTDEEILEVVRDSVMTVWHAACTCKMGKSDDPMAVLDSKARVRGVNNLRVVDASSFPLLPPGHPQSTIYALAEKIADDMAAGN